MESAAKEYSEMNQEQEIPRAMLTATAARGFSPQRPHTAPPGNIDSLESDGAIPVVYSSGSSGSRGIGPIVGSKPGAFQTVSFEQVLRSSGVATALRFHVLRTRGALERPTPHHRGCVAAAWNHAKLFMCCGLQTARSAKRDPVRRFANSFCGFSRTPTFSRRGITRL